jgi:tetratricopeptide (TPR) repeat protein
MCSRAYIQAAHACKLEGRYAEAGKWFLAAYNERVDYGLSLKLEPIQEAYNIFIIHDVPQAIECLNNIIEDYFSEGMYVQVYQNKYLLAEAYEKNKDTARAIEAYNYVLCLAETTPCLKEYEVPCRERIKSLQAGTTPC